MHLRVVDAPPPPASPLDALREVAGDLDQWAEWWGAVGYGKWSINLHTAADAIRAASAELALALLSE